MSGYTNDCPRLGKWIGGCRYEPRFSLPAYEPQFGIKANGESLIDIIKVSRPLVYEGDVCIRCGKHADRKPHTQEPSP